MRSGSLFEVERNAECLIDLPHDFGAQFAKVANELRSRYGAQLTREDNAICCQTRFWCGNRNVARIDLAHAGSIDQRAYQHDRTMLIDGVPAYEHNRSQ